MGLRIVVGLARRNFLTHVFGVVHGHESSEAVKEALGRQMQIRHRITLIKTQPEFTIVPVIQKREVGIAHFLRESFHDLRFRRSSSLSREAFAKARDDRPKLLDSLSFHVGQEHRIEWRWSPLLVDARGLFERLEPLLILAIVRALPFRGPAQNQVARQKCVAGDSALPDDDVVQLRVQLRGHVALNATLRYMVEHGNDAGSHHSAHDSSVCADCLWQVEGEEVDRAYVTGWMRSEESGEVVKRASIHIVRRRRDGQLAVSGAIARGDLFFRLHTWNVTKLLTACQ